MKQGILGQYLVSDARQTGRHLIASLEALEELEAQDEKKAGIIEEASTLALRVGRDFPEDSDMHQNMFKVLEGLGATEGMNVSNEGLVELAGKLSGFWRKPKPDTKHMPSDEKGTWSERDKAIRQFIADMEKTYLDAKWLDKQKFVEGTVPAKDFSGNFQIDGKPVTDPLANLEQHKKFIEYIVDHWQPELAALNKQVQALHAKASGTAKALVGKDQEEEAIEEVKKVVAELNALPDPTAKFPRFTGTAMGNMIPVVNTKFKVGWVKAERKMDVKPDDTLPALDKEGVLKVANLVKTIMSNPNFFKHMPWLEWLDFKGGDWFSNWIYDADNSVYTDYYDRFYYQGACDLWSDEIWVLNNQFRVVISFIKWIDRSVK